ncbi:hypothetical protein HYV56_01970 [Candidatus Peregrinibacteria bacterium]|nr:hypothetical protein [Candidatus Peregrinibacteria bacterium]
MKKFLERQKIDTFEKAIIGTVAYFDLFDFPLKEEELKAYLLRYKKTFYGGRHTIFERLYSLKRENVYASLRKVNNYYTLKDRENIITIRQEREIRSKKLWKKIQFFGSILSVVPFVRLVAVCNNLAYNNASGKSDIDLFVITDRNYLFLARFLVTFLLHISGVRRHGKHVYGRFCLSFFINENHLNLEKIVLSPQDIYLAYWMRTLKPLFGQKTYQKFLEANEKWLKDYFDCPHDHLKNLISSPANLSGNHNLHLSIKNDEIEINPLFAIQKIFEFIIKIFFGFLIEKGLKAWMKKRAEKKAKKLNKTFPFVVIEDNILKFHDKDRREEFQKKWEESLKKLYKKTYMG